MARILLAGEGWFTTTIHVKGVDQFILNSYGEGAAWMRKAIEGAGHEFVHLSGPRVPREFPETMEQISQYDAVILSDIGANSLLLHPEVAMRSIAHPNRLALIEAYVRNGGGFAMIGGYLTFQGIEGKGRYHDTPVERALPVTMSAIDDRVETPEGVIPKVVADHEITRGLAPEWPALLGYNKVTPKPDASVLVTVGDDPLIVTGVHGKGRTLAFTSDCAPHWAPPTFLEWEGYGVLFGNVANWLVGA